MSDRLKVIQEEEKKDPWYQDGLRFQCTGCGQCCTGFPGYVWVNEEEIQALAQFLNLSIKEFASRYLRTVGSRFSLLEKPLTFDCIFLKDNKCQVYSVRPKQCRTFPFWRTCLESKESWEKTAKRCEGIHSEATFFSKEEIEMIAKETSL